MSTYVPIQAITLSSATATVTFSGIPQTYTDLIIVAETQISNNDFMMAVRFNGDSSTLYSYTTLDGNGSIAESSRRSNMSLGTLQRIISNGSRFISTVQVMNYANTTTNKTYIARGNQAGRWVSANVGLYRSTSAISSITISEAGDGGSGAFTGQLASGSTFTLYGVGSGSPRAFGGDEVRTDGTFWYHIFRSSGRFEAVNNLAVEYLIVAGGGGGATNQYHGGGGGAGGMRTGSATITSGISNTVIVGAGAAGWSNTGSANYQGNDGSASSFFGISATGGGGGGGFFISGAGGNGRPGGSGGGAGSASGQVATGGTGVSGQGFAGGNYDGSSGSPKVGGGGGGAGGVGSNGAISTSSPAGTGGPGREWPQSSGTFYAGGGGGSSESGYSPAGGIGGGGAGSQSNGTNGSPNTGGGGGTGERSGTSSGSGGSGIVIVRYAV